MKIKFPSIGLAKLCGWFGITRQAYYKSNLEFVSSVMKEGLLLQKIHSIRKKHPRIGTRKLYEMLKPFMVEHAIKIGRDALFMLLSSNHLLIRKRKRCTVTTDSNHWLRKYPNLIRELVPSVSNQLWVSDITYWKLKNRFVYISLITDAYSHKIVGYNVSESLDVKGCVQALQIAFSSALGASECHLPSLTHHSDRGSQYCSFEYVRLLKDKKINISMTENGDPLENAIAERINGIIKGEYLDCYEVETVEQAKNLLADVVNLYNNERPHLSIGNFTPNEIHGTTMTVEKKWKSYYKKKLPS